jgi:predicted amidophosphoribosyltransferase
VVGIGESRCGHCKLRLSISVEEPVCPNCRYNLHGLTEARCPECGCELDAEDVAGRHDATKHEAAKGEGAHAVANGVKAHGET